MYDALTIADYIISYYEQHYETVSNLKLQKLLYFLQAEYLLKCDKPLFEDDIEARSFGPVVASVYEKFKFFAGASVPSHNVVMPFLAKEDKRIVDELLSRLCKYSAAYLTEITLNQTPWLRNYSEYSNKIIPISEIKEYFKEG